MQEIVHFRGYSVATRELSLSRIRAWPANRFRGLNPLALSQIHRIGLGLASSLEIPCDSPRFLDPVQDDIDIGNVLENEADQLSVSLRHLKRSHLARS